MSIVNTTFDLIIFWSMEHIYSVYLGQVLVANGS